MPQSESNLKERLRNDVREPDSYKVILYNDEETTMEFVIELLEQVFFLNSEEANTLMLRIHNEGSGVAGVYLYDIAMSKTQKAITKARKEGFPLVIKCLKA